jgi:hypothetical protein
MIGSFPSAARGRWRPGGGFFFRVGRRTLVESLYLLTAPVTAAPRRPLVLAAKAVVLGAVTLAAGEISSFAAFFAGQAVLQAPAPHATLGQPGVLCAYAMAALAAGAWALTRRDA